MTRISTIFTSVLTAAIALASANTALAVSFDPPEDPAPRRTTAGATRQTGTCIEPGEELAVLNISPEQVGRTVSAQPTLLVYAPNSTAETIEVTLTAEDGTEVFRKSLATPEEAGIMAIALDEQPLEVGEAYQWYVSMICNDVDRAANPLVYGWVRRVDTEAIDTETATADDYAEAGIWYETVSALYELRRESPENSELAAQWTELLASVGMENLADKPLID